MNYFHEFNPLSMSKEIITNKKRAAKNEVMYMIMRLQEMFKYEGLPETIPQDYLEYYIMTNGQAFITKVHGELYAFMGNCGGEPDPYFRPTRYIIANPALNYSADLDIVKDGVLMRNDWCWFGLVPMLSKYAVMISENFLTMRVADIVLRAMALLSAPDDKTKAAAELFLNKLEKGELGVIGETPFFDGIKMQSPPSNNGSYLTQFIELHQFLRGALWQELGIDALSNMKRESLSEGETHLNEGTLLPLTDHMLRVRQEDVQRLNAMYGLSVSVDFTSSWKLLRQQMEAANSLANGSEETANSLVTQSGEADETHSNDEIQLQSSSLIQSEAQETNEIGGDEGSENGISDETSSNEETVDINININIDTPANELAEDSSEGSDDSESADGKDSEDTEEKEDD